jgi:hypothetical protein
LYWNIDLTSEEEEKLLIEIAEKMYNYGIDVPAILFFETMKPLTYFGSQMGRFALSPFLPLLGDDLGLTGEKMLQLFEKEENVEKIIKHIEDLSEKEKQKKLENKDKVKQEKKGWRRFLPF